MSYVTDVVCLFDWDEDVPEWFWTSPEAHGNTRGRLNDIAAGRGDADHGAGDHWGGGKHNQACVPAGAFNYLDLEGWLDGISAGVWPTENRPVITVHVEHETDWWVYLWDGTAFVRAEIPAAALEKGTPQ